MPSRLARIQRSPAYVAAFLGALTLPQASALARQFQLGFRPFAHEPVRVAFSWDMFSTRIERCKLDWSHPLDAELGGISGMRDLGTTLEWDIVYDRVDFYRWAAGWGCRHAPLGTRVSIRCFMPEGFEVKDEFDCR